MTGYFTEKMFFWFFSCILFKKSISLHLVITLFNYYSF